MEENAVVAPETEQLAAVDGSATTEVAASESSGKLVFYGIVGLVILGPIGAVVFGILWWKGRKKNKQLQGKIDDMAKEAPAATPAPVAEPKAEETKAETPAENK